jgi:prepilin-type N-terminal cleavage/methylation domain-containing protein
MPRVRSNQAGFTLIEVMFVVAIIAVLAAIALPEFMSSSRKTKSNSEVTAFFAAIATKQEQYRVETGGYLATATCPAATSTTGTVVTCGDAGQPWAPLNVKVPMSTAYCTYTTVTNAVGVSVGPGNITVGADTFTMTSQTVGPWYYILARCDQDGDGTTANFFTSSTDSTIQKSAGDSE